MKRNTFLHIINAILIDCIGSLMIGSAVIVFAVSADFAPGGISGMAIIVNYLTKMPIGRTALLLNIPLILISFRLLGIRFLLTSVKTMIISCFFIDYVVCWIPPFTGSRLLASVLSGLCAGTGYGMIYLQNSSTGGSDFLIMSVKKLKPQMSIGQLTQILDGSVIFVAAFVFRDIAAVIYGLIYTFVNSLAIDFVMRFFTRDNIPLPLKRIFVPRPTSTH